MATNRNDYWLNAVWGELPYKVPGVEGLVLPVGNNSTDRPSSPLPGHIRYNETDHVLEAYVNFQWETVLSGDIPTIITVSNCGAIPPGPYPDGTMLTVLDDGDGHELLFIWNSANSSIPDTVPGQCVKFRWRLLSTTELFSSAVVYRNAVVSDTAGTVPVGSPFATLFNPYVKEINVDIQIPFAGGVILSLQEAGGGPLMDSSLINPQLVGTYQLKIPGSNNIPDGFNDDYLLTVTGQIQLNVVNPSSSGRAVVYVKAVTQLEESP